MVINAGMLHTLLRVLVREMKPHNGGELQTEAIGSLVIAHAAGAAAASFAAGFLPGAGGVAALVISAGFIWSMYYRICKELDIQLSKNKAKALGAAVGANLLANLAALLAAGVLTTFIPGVGAVTMAMLDFAMVYVAAIVFIKLLIGVFKAKKDITAMDTDELKAMAENMVKDTDIHQAAKEAKTVFKEARKDGTIDSTTTKPIDDAE